MVTRSQFTPILMVHLWNCVFSCCCRCRNVWLHCKNFQGSYPHILVSWFCVHVDPSCFLFCAAFLTALSCVCVSDFISPLINHLLCLFDYNHQQNFGLVTSTFWLNQLSDCSNLNILKSFFSCAFSVFGGRYLVCRITTSLEEYWSRFFPIQSFWL